MLLWYVDWRGGNGSSLFLSISLSVSPQLYVSLSFPPVEGVAVVKGSFCQEGKEKRGEAPPTLLISVNTKMIQSRTERSMYG